MRNRSVRIGGREFQVLISRDRIEERISELAKECDGEGGETIFVPVMTGAFYFSSRLLSYISFPYILCCVSASSYEGTESRGVVDIIHHKNPEIFKDKKVIILEDIIDTGLTASELTREFYKCGARDVLVISMLLKPGKLKYDIPLHSAGFEIGDEFVLGFGLDYEEDGRYLEDIYVLKESGPD